MFKRLLDKARTKGAENEQPGGSPEIKVLLNTTWKKQQFERKVFILSSLVYGAIVLVLLGLLIVKKEVIILTPPQIKEKISITRSMANEPYYKEMALFLTQLVGNLSPNTVDYALEVFSSYLDPSIYETVSDSLAEVADTIRKKQIATAFYPDKIGKVGAKWYVVGSLYKFDSSKSQNAEIRKGGIVTYEINFKVRSFRLYITGFKQRNGDTLREAVRAAKRQRG